MKFIAFVIRGDFNEDEFAFIAAAVRVIDQQRPDAHLEVVAVDPRKTALETAGEILRDAVPEMEGRTTEFMTLSRAGFR